MVFDCALSNWILAACAIAGTAIQVWSIVDRRRSEARRITATDSDDHPPRRQLRPGAMWFWILALIAVWFYSAILPML